MADSVWPKPRAHGLEFCNDVVCCLSRGFVQSSRKSFASPVRRRGRTCLLRTMLHQKEAFGRQEAAMIVWRPLSWSGAGGQDICVVVCGANAAPIVMLCNREAW